LIFEAAKLVWGVRDVFLATAEYHYPPHKPVSDGCKDLLKRIFVVDPAERITIAGIWRHPWFRAGMPADLDIDRYNDHYLRITMVCSQLPNSQSPLNAGLHICFVV
jgi:serine/threonine protein kinase